MRDIKLEVMFYAYNQSMAKVIKKHYTTVDRLCNSNKFFKQDLEILCKRQFTGLKDKNGVDIYEGDIVKCNKNFWPENRGWTEILEVEPITCSQFDDEYGGGQDYVESVVSIEVLGNKYENPELLESK